MSTEEEWVCPKEGCERDAHGHSLAEAMEHIFEIDAEAAERTSANVLAKIRERADEIADAAAAMVVVLGPPDL